MSIMIVDDALSAKLRESDEPVEFCTRDGRRLGFFTPAKPMQHDLEPQIDEDEICRRESRTGGRTLTEILSDLEKRG